MRRAFVLAIAACGSPPPPLPVAPPPVAEPAPACGPTTIDHTWGSRAGHADLTVTDRAIFEYVDRAIIRRSLVGEPPRVIPSGFIYGLQEVVGGGRVWWLKGIRPDVDVEDAMMLELWSAPERGGTPTVVLDGLATPADLFAAPDGVFVTTADGLVHVDRDGNRRVEVPEKVDAVAVAGDTVYFAIEAAIVRRKLAGGELELVARLSSSGQVGGLAALGDRAVWYESGGVVSTNRPGSETPVALARMRSKVHVAASPSELYVAAGNVMYAVEPQKLRAVAKARADIAVFGADSHAIYALVEEIGLVRLCPRAGSVRTRAPSAMLDCPPNHGETWAAGLRHVCIDAAGDLTAFHRDWYQSGDLQEERAPDGRFMRRWADGSPIVEGHYDEQGFEDGEWLEYTDDGVKVTHYDKGHKLP
jgi:hypothetical protein